MTDVRGILERTIAAASDDQLCELIGELATGIERAKLKLSRPASTAPTSTSMQTAEQIAAALGVKVSAVREWSRAGKIPTQHYGRFTRFDLDAVKAALEGNSKLVSPGLKRGAKKPSEHSGLAGQVGPLTGRLPSSPGGTAP